MTKHLDLADIQCNVLRDLGSGFPKARFVCIRIPEGGSRREAAATAERARAFIMAYRDRVTNALCWNRTGETNYPGGDHETVERPEIAINLAISWHGLRLLGLPHRTLAAMPPEFIDGMRARARILGDQDYTDENDPSGWDAAWATGAVHILVALNATMDPATGAPGAALEAAWRHLKSLVDVHGLEIVTGHGGDPTAQYQDASLLLEKDGDRFVATAREHFGFTDGFGNPVFEGQHDGADARHLRGNGKMVARETGGFDWAPLATGEILLGHADEAQELPVTAAPEALMRNGTFLVYRKLHQNVGSFKGALARAAEAYAATTGLRACDAKALIMAKFCGRWADGIPLAAAPDLAAYKQLKAALTAEDRAILTDPSPAKAARRAANLERIFYDFSYADDPVGAKCPLTAHLRRANTRDSLEPVRRPSSALNNRRRIMRRGIPYGATTDDDTGEHGIVFMALCANIQRQFEFVQQQWLQYGLDADAGNDDCPIVGSRRSGGGTGKFIVTVDPKSGEAPFICAGLPRFVETRGGDYFFLPSLTALRMIGMGTIDPT